jgi:osmotically-inducible protein OsmY
MNRRSAHGPAAVALAAFLALGATACGNRGAENANNTNANRAATANSNYGSASGGAANTSGDTALKNSIQANLTKAGISGVEVEVSEGVVTLKGNVTRDKMQDAVKAANDAGPKRVLNQLNAQ